MIIIIMIIIIIIIQKSGDEFHFSDKCLDIVGLLLIPGHVLRRFCEATRACLHAALA
jgi:hypothetical protein